MKKNVNKDITHCCDPMKYAVEDPFCYIFYNEKFREYNLRDDKSTSARGMTYCYNCGTRLPESLRDTWFEILRTEYHIDDPVDDINKIPKEFKSDEWWKKRGL